MKKIILTLVVAFTCASFAYSQVSQDDVALVQSLYGKDKRELVKQYMKLSGKPDTAFWKIYDAYENERKAMGAERLKLLEDYANNYSTLTDAKAEEIIKKSIALNANFLKLQQKYYPKMKSAIGAVKAAQFTQLEMYLDNAVRNSVNEHIPFIGELDRSEKH